MNEIEIKPILWRLIIEQWQAATALGIFYALYKWLLEWPAPWILLLLFARALIQSFLYRHNLSLKISNRVLSGPTWTKASRVTINLSEKFSRDRFLSITTIKGNKGKEVSYRRSWYQPSQIKAFEKIISSFP